MVTGRKTFSSAVINVMDFLKYTNAILIGESTGGKPNHYGEVKVLELPSSKLQVVYSTKYFKNSGTDMNTIKPRIGIQTSFNDFINGIDPVYEWIKTH